MTDAPKIFFPMTYSDLAADKATFEAAKAFEGKTVRVVTATGHLLSGRVVRAETGSIGRSFHYGVQFLLSTGSKHFPLDKRTGVDFQSIEIVQEVAA